MTEIVDARPSAIAGSWYPANSSELTLSVDSYLQLANSRQFPPSNIKGLIVPHAGHIYSGQVAGKAFGLVKETQPDTVVILSPHHGYSPYAFLSSKHTHYQTPLGQVPIQHGLLDNISKQLETETDQPITLVGQDSEHSLEIQLPFLQRVLNHPFQLIPIMMRSYQFAHLIALGDAIANCLAGRAWLMVISTDLSHFKTIGAAHNLDRDMLRAWESFDEEGILRSAMVEKTEACGLNAVLAGIRACKQAGATGLSVLGYDTSARVTGDRSSVVGYASAVITSDI